MFGNMQQKLLAVMQFRAVKRNQLDPKKRIRSQAMAMCSIYFKRCGLAVEHICL